MEMGGLFAITLPNEASRLSELRRALDEWLHARGVAHQARAAVVLAAHEAAANAVDHARSDDPLIVRARADDQAVVVEVEDKGAWKPTLLKNDERGRGLMLIAGLMHEFEIDHAGPGTTIRMRRRLDAQSG